MRKKIVGIESAYREAIEKPLENMNISANLVVELIDRITELEMGVIDLMASLRTCQSTSNAIMDQYKDL